METKKIDKMGSFADGLVALIILAGTAGAARELFNLYQKVSEPQYKTNIRQETSRLYTTNNFYRN